MTNAIYSFSGQHTFLSNFSAANVELDGEVYPTVEHAYQAAKTLDVDERHKIRLQAKTAGQAKKMGNKVKLRKNWEMIKVVVMRSLLEQKFAVGTMPHDWLLKTGDAELIEGNYWHDTFWGVCDGVGENWLGRLLMEIRDELGETSDR